MITFTVTAAVLIFAPARGLVVLPVNGKKEGPGLCHGGAAGGGADAVEEDGQDRGGEARAGENCVGLSSS